jgi:KUP system potassium uptake protein
MQSSTLTSDAPPAGTAGSHHADGHHTQSSHLWKMTLGALGVVYGDIGTSPIYAFRESVHAAMGESAAPVREDVLGVLSLILWSLTIIVTLKYVSILLKVDNRGEGGTLALMAMARSVIYRNTTGFLFLGLAGAALFYGDGIITPAISVLSAIEGLDVATPAFDPYILPITIAIILVLFLFQYKGTDKVSSLFGPVMAFWFIVLAVTGVRAILIDPGVALAILPNYGLMFLLTHGKISLLVLGNVFLAVTGAEALYADLGHFGRKPIQLAWAWLTFPCLTLNYLGQGALVLHDPSTLDNPFFKLAPGIFLMPLVVLSGVATIIASQAVITGAYSMTHQAINLGLLPRMVVRHTSAKHSGQIYLPGVNYILMVGVIALVLVFKSSSNLAAAYGISVTGTMVLTAITTFFVVWQILEWPLWKVFLWVGSFLVVDCVFLTANMLKVLEGGWVPLMIAALLIVLMVTWIQGSFILNSRARKRDIPLDKFIREYKTRYPDLKRVKGSGFFFALDPNRTPAALLQNIRHNKMLHEKNVVLSVRIEPVPYVPPEGRTLVTHINDEFSTVLLRFGFQEHPNIQQELVRLNQTPNNGIDFDWDDTSLYLSHRSLRSHPRYGLPVWQDFIYIWLHKHAADPTDFYKLPVSRVVEIGRHMII